MSRTKYELYYWPSIQGRGELVRLALEESGARYVDVARLPANEGGGVPAIMRVLGGELGGARPFAPPVLRAGKLVIAQTANILAFVGARHGLLPSDEALALEVQQHQLTVADFLGEAHDVHHPIAVSLYYEDQKPEAKRRAAAFRKERIPKFLRYFEAVLRANRKSRGRWLVGKDLTYVDLSMFQVLEGVRYAFPKSFGRLAGEVSGLVELGDRVRARPRIAAYLASPRRLPFNEHDLFRHYKELDA
jgi:glutathione S-transferase